MEVSEKTPASRREFGAIDGLRTILSFWVVSCHVVGLMLYMVYAGDPAQPDKLQYLAQSWWISLASGLGYQVDVFFMISGFLTTWGFLNKKSHYSGFVLRDTIVFIIRRLLRLWPMVLVQIVISYFWGDYNANNLGEMFSNMLFPISPHLPMAFSVQWSTRVDLIGTLLVLVVFTLLEKTGLLNLPASILMAALSFIPKVWRFLDEDFRKHVSYLLLRMNGGKGDSFMPLYMSVERQRYYAEVLYPGKFHIAIMQEPSLIKRNLMRYEYLVWHQRITPFFIGMVLAIAYRQVRQRWTNLSAEDIQKIKQSVVGKLLHFCILCISLLVTLQPVLLSVLGNRNNNKEAKVLAEGELPPFKLDFFVSVLNRPLFAAGYAYLMYRCLVPEKHYLHLSWLSSLLNSAVLQDLSVYSYGVFALHMKVMVEVMWRYLPPRILNIMFGPSLCFLPFITIVLVTYTMTSFLAFLVYHHFEEPVQTHLISPLVAKIDAMFRTSSPSSSVVREKSD